MTFEEILNTKGKLVYTNKGISMLPWIHEGRDILVIEAVSSNLKKYDVVLFVRHNISGSGQYVLHRIIKCYNDKTYYIMGDNQLSGERVTQENIIGILTRIKQPEKVIDVNDKGYQCKVRLWWIFVIPAKICYYRLRRCAALLVRKLFRISSN